MPRRRIPAVSTSRICLPSSVTTVSTTSRVVPATGDTSARSVPTRPLSSEDFPVLGRPMMATLTSPTDGSVPAEQTEQAPCIRPPHRGDEERVAKPEPVQLVGPIAVDLAVGLVANEDHR